MNFRPDGSTMDEADPRQARLEVIEKHDLAESALQVKR